MRCDETKKKKANIINLQYVKPKIKEGTNRTKQKVFILYAIINYIIDHRQLL